MAIFMGIAPRPMAAVRSSMEAPSIINMMPYWGGQEEVHGAVHQGVADKNQPTPPQSSGVWLVM
jgi:hypothetical protein